MPRKQPPAAIAQQVQADLASGSALGGAAALRSRLMEIAGVTEAEQARTVRLAFDKRVAALTAKRTVRLVVGTGRGESRVEEFIEDDTAMQLRAAEGLHDMLGVMPSKTAGSLTGGGPMTVNVSFAPAPAIEVIDVTPQ